MPFVRNEDIACINIAPGVRQRPLISAATGSQGIFMGEVTVDPGCKIPWHYHSFEDIILVRSGKGSVQVDNEVYEVVGGNSVIVPPDIPHQVVNTGDEPICIIFGFPSANVDRILVEGRE